MKEEEESVKKSRKVKVKESIDVKCSEQVSSRGQKTSISNQELKIDEVHIDVGGEGNVEYINKGKRENKKNKKGRNENGDDCEEIHIDKSCAESNSGSGTFKKRGGKEKVLDVEIAEGIKKKKRKKTKLVMSSENTEGGMRDQETENKEESTDKSSKNVEFSGHSEVFPTSDRRDDRQENHGKKLYQGKRFSRQEDKMVKDAVYNYIETHNLGEKGLDMILNCKKNSNVKSCWRDISAALPWRPYLSVYKRAHLLFERAESHYKTMAAVLAKNRNNVRDTWRRIQLSSRRTGNWNQAEYQILFDLVNKVFRMRVHEERKSKHGLLRDNIRWQAISHKLATRTDVSCCFKWYRKLSSSMVKDGIWDDVDDYRLLNELLKLDACCVDDVDWDNLLEHRSGDVCRKRWRQMVNHIGEHGIKSFVQQVEVLAKRYCPELVETRESFDSMLCAFIKGVDVSF
ncbi:hypothetical protein MKW98_001503 [Papaver atlanticum]|uniref:Myb-like domain-containing protein n=1 Tax=Papaver atlanticum TaxID=357466 RepID=A0AAD4XK59_9MAGN|nr:hypothetical protein MKW98_001503 [Papaver atlanticum]